MTGPEHFAEAEACLDRADRIKPSKLSRDLYAAAQAHATLALVAATAQAGTIDCARDGEQQPWRTVGAFR